MYDYKSERTNKDLTYLNDSTPTLPELTDRIIELLDSKNLRIEKLEKDLEAIRQALK